MGVPKDIIIRRIADEARVVFKYPYDRAFIRACEAMRLRGLLTFAADPIKSEDGPYKAWYADIEKLNEDSTYADFKMLVTDFYTADIRQKFDDLFPDVRKDRVEAAVHNPSTFMEAQRPVVDALIEKYKNTTSPLEFYGSKHQAEGVALFLRSLNNKHCKGAINADAPGLGKTRQAVVAAIEAGKKNVLVIAPKTAKVATWPSEIKLVDPKATIFLADQKNYQARAQWTLIHWDILRKMPREFFDNASTYDLVIADEFHRAASPDSQRSQAIAEIADRVTALWGLTGTPVTKRPKNVVNLLALLKHPLADTKSKVWKFLNRYCGGIDWTGHYNFDDAKNIDELHELLRDVLIRRESDSTNLPDKIREVKKVVLTESQRKVYDGAWAEYCNRPDVKEKQQSVTYPFEVVKTGVLRKSISLAKVPHVIEWAEELIEAGEKVVIFTDFTDVFQAYMKHFGSKAVGIHGATPEDQRGEIVKRFQEDDKVKAFVGNIKAAGEGITLTAASYLAFNDIAWRPVDQLQAENRIYRGGAKKTCFIVFFLGEDTCDEKGFKDFIEHKDVVERIVNRRDENGEVKDFQWTGDIQGLGLEKKKKTKGTSLSLKANPGQVFRKFQLKKP